MAHVNKRIDEEAARWAIRLAAEPLSASEQRKLDAWLSSDFRRQGALIRARAAWVGLDRFAALSGGAGPNMPARSARPRFLRSFAAAAALVLAVSIAWVTLSSGGERYASNVGEVRRIALDDGSHMLLNTDSQAVIQFSGARRDVRLEKGEALFEVAKDPRRPFVVEAGELTVKAVGTAFVVRREDSSVDVTVTEGVVEVARPGEPGKMQPQRVAASQRAVSVESAALQIEPIQFAESQRRLAWRNGMVAFDGEPLLEAAAEVNRHSRRKIVVDDAALAARPMVGVFRASDSEGFARTAATALGATIVEDGNMIRIAP